MKYCKADSPKLKAAAIAAALLFPFRITFAEPDFHHDFQNGTFADGATLALPFNRNGFTWAGARGGIVRDESPSGGRLILWGKSTSRDEFYAGRDYRTPNGLGPNSMVFRYRSKYDDTASKDDKQWSERRFNLGTAYPEIWIRWWMRVPTNLTEYPFAETQWDGKTIKTWNNKIFMVWMDGYSNKGDGSTVGMEFRPSGWYVKVSQGRYRVLGGDTGSVPFIRIPEDAGRWMQIVVRIRVESSEDAGDGLVQAWRRWSTDEEFVQTHNVLNRRIRVPENGPHGFQRGYLQGWHQEYPQETEWLWADFAVSSSSLLESDTLTMPKAPTEMIVD